MKEIRQAIVKQLKAIHPRVHFLKAPDTSVFPYLVYTLEIIDLEDNLRMVTLDVDGWDNKEDTTALEELMSAVKNTFNRKLIINENIFVSFYLDRQLPLEDDDPQLNRRTNIFMGRLYER